LLLVLIAALLALSPARAKESKKPDAEKPNPAATPEQRKDKWWQDRHGGFVARAKKGDVNVVFIGDSITHDWEGKGKEVWKKNFEPLKAANFGIGGDQTSHVLWRITKGKELEGISPKAFVVMIGTNNMGHQTAKQIAGGVKAIVGELKKQKPKAQILLLAIFPRDAMPGTANRKKIAETNKILAKLADKQVHYLDIGDKFLDKKGVLSKDIMPDALHLSEKGYGIWADAINDKLKKLVDSEK
jgi:lysophospholipase L1-like esterase